MINVTGCKWNLIKHYAVCDKKKEATIYLVVVIPTRSYDKSIHQQL